MLEDENKNIHEQESKEQEFKEQPFVRIPSYKKQLKCICLILFGMLVCFQYHFQLDYYDLEWWISIFCGILGLGIAFFGDIRNCSYAIKRFFTNKLN